MRTVAGTLIVACGLSLLALACVGPEDGRLPGVVDTPTGPSRQLETNLRGQVLDMATLLPVAGATVRIDTVSWVSSEDGWYNLQRLTLTAATLVATRAGYESTSVYIPLDGGDRVFNLRLRASPTPSQ